MQRDREAAREEERKRKRRIFNEKLLAEAKKSRDGWTHKLFIQKVRAPLITLKRVKSFFPSIRRDFLNFITFNWRYYQNARHIIHYGTQLIIPNPFGFSAIYLCMPTDIAFA